MILFSVDHMYIILALPEESDTSRLPARLFFAWFLKIGRGIDADRTDATESEQIVPPAARRIASIRILFRVSEIEHGFN
jgi:hypothetical protein